MWRLHSCIRMGWCTTPYPYGIRTYTSNRPGISKNKAAFLSLFVPVLWRSAGQRTGSFLDLLLWRKEEGICFYEGFVNKRIQLQVRFFGALLVLLAGRGGEGDGEEGLVDALVGAWWGFGAGAGSATSTANSKRRRCFAVAISGQKGGHAVLLRLQGESFFLLKWMVYFCLGASAKAPTAPSGSVLGGNGAGRAWRQRIDGG